MRLFTIAMLASVMIVPLASADDWPQWRGPGKDGLWHESGVVDRFSSEQIAIKWRMPIGGGYSGPTVAKGRVYVTDRLVEPKQVERIHCFDEKSGKVLWSKTYAAPYRDIGYDAGPRASVTVHDGRAYALGATGIFHCLDAATGDVHWKKDLNEQYKIKMPIWGISAAPVIEDNLVILQIGGEDACLVAFDRVSGKEVWRALDDKASYSTPVIFDYHGRRLMVCYTGDHVVGMSPRSGKVYWKHPFPPTRMVIGVADPVIVDDYIFLTNFFDGSMLLKMEDKGNSVSQVWKRAGASEKETDSLHAIITTPIVDGRFIYGMDSYGELRCLELLTGNRVWEDLTAVPRARWATIHMVRNEDKIWMFNERGELIICQLSKDGFKEISRAKLIDPTEGQLRRRGGVCWSHPAYANRHVFARNDKEIVCASLAK